MLEIRQTARPDVRAVYMLLEGLDDLYPDGFAWLDRRLDDVLRGQATLWEARLAGSLVGLAIVAQKGPRSRKLCTFKIAAPFRRRKLGEQLLTAIKAQWMLEEVETAYVTVDHADPATQMFFLAEGFVTRVERARRYAADRYDDVFLWQAGGGRRSAAIR